MVATPKISIIVPVYNTDKYLRKCIDSILDQTFTDFEVLLVNDGSTDNSGDICDEYAELDFRVRVFHKENGGVSSARNLGLENILGDYVFFIDADDYLSIDALNLLFLASIKYDADIVVANYYEILNDERRIVDVKVVKDKYEYLRSVLLRQSSFTLWGKLFKAELFVGYRFIPGYNFGEDFMVYPKLIYDALNICKIDDALYFYVRDNVDSYTLSIFKEQYVYQLLQIGTNLIYHFRAYDDEKLSLIIAEFIPMYKIHLLFMSHTNSKAFYRVLREYKLELTEPSLVFNSFKYRLTFLLSNRCPYRLFHKLIKFAVFLNHKTIAL